LLAPDRRSECKRCKMFIFVLPYIIAGRTAGVDRNEEIAAMLSAVRDDRDQALSAVRSVELAIRNCPRKSSGVWTMRVFSVVITEFLDESYRTVNLLHSQLDICRTHCGIFLCQVW